MSQYAPALQEMTDTLRARGVRRVVYFHCDHFEPWQNFDNRGMLHQRHVDELCIFADQMAKFDYARKLTLFYRTHVSYTYDSARELRRVAPDDLFGIVPRQPQDTELCRHGMKYLTSTVPHEIQVHVHHEGMTSNTSHTAPHVVDWYAKGGDRFDAAKMSMILEVFKENIRAETDIDLQRWFYVHGHWALQGSDEDTCRISNELAILMQNGCLGDFTFPAGRGWVNPRIEVPYFCTPIDRARGYDLPEGAPELAYGNASAPARGKFLIWASLIKHNRSSIDFYAPWVRRNLEQPAEWARDIVRDSYVIDGTLYFKTHAHSMFPYYREMKRRPIYPHAHPGVQTVFGLVFDAASSAGAEIEFLTASEVYDRFVAAPWTPPEGFALQVPNEPIPERPRPAAKPEPVAAPPAAPDTPPVVEAPPAGVAPPEPAAVLALPEPTGPRPLFRPEPREVAGLLPLEPPAAIELVNRIALPVVLERIARLGEAGSGAYRLYRERAERGAMVTPYEAAIVEFIAQLPGFDQYHEIGSGFGILPITLALCGRRTLGLELAGRRHAGASEVYDAVLAERPDLGLRGELLGGSFPAALEGRDTSRCLAILTDFEASMSEEAEAAVLAGLGRYAAVLLDVQRFVQRRREPEEVAALLHRLGTVGLTGATEVLDLKGGGRYFMAVAG